MEDAHSSHSADGFDVIIVGFGEAAAVTERLLRKQKLSVMVLHGGNERFGKTHATFSSLAPRPRRRGKDRGFRVGAMNGDSHAARCIVFLESSAMLKPQGLHQPGIFVFEHFSQGLLIANTVLSFLRSTGGLCQEGAPISRAPWPTMPVVAIAASERNLTALRSRL
jgi:hypothetical protein